MFFLQSLEKTIRKQEGLCQLCVIHPAQEGTGLR